MKQHFSGYLMAAAAIWLCSKVEAGETWDGGGANDNWTTGANWNATGFPPMQIPPPNNGTANIHMAGVNGLTPLVNVPYSIHSLTFDSSAGAFVILGAQELTIGAGGIVNNDAQMQSVIGPVKLSADQFWNAASGRLQMDVINLNGFDVALTGAHQIDLINTIVGTGIITIADSYTSTVTMVGGGSNAYSGLTDVQSGTLKLQKGGVAVPGDLMIGSGATVLLAAHEQISQAAGNEITIAAGGLLDVNTQTETVGVLNLGGSVSVFNGGSFAAAHIQIVGTAQWVGNTHIDGSFDISGGAQFTDSNCFIANAAGSTGTVTLIGPQSFWEGGATRVGYRGDGSLLLSDGASGIGYSLTLGAEPGSTGTMAIDGLGSEWNAGLSAAVGWSGIGELSITNGGTMTAGTSIVGYQPRSAGSVTIEGEGSTWFSVANVSVGWESGGTMDVLSGGSLYSDEGRVGAGPAAVGEVAIDGPGSKWIMNDVLAVGLHGQGAVLVADGGYMESLWATVGDWPDGVGSVTVDGPGSMWTNLGELYLGYSGIGALIVTNDGSVSATDVIVGALASVHGDGAIIGNIENGGVVSPGASAGALHIDGNYTQLADAELRIDLASASNYDQVIATGSAMLAGTLTIDLRYLPAAGQTFTIVSAESVSGTFAEVAPTLFNVIYTPNSVILEVPTAPCPADVTNDGNVNVSDLLFIINAWGACPNPNDCPADINGDDQVNVIDLLAVINAWGVCP